MGDAKRLIVKPITSADANALVCAIHYSHKVVPNSQLHLGVFLDGLCGGVLQFGPSMDKRKLISLVRGTQWNEFMELNRLALADWLPRNGESRAIGYAFRWMKKQFPFLKWVVSFADGTQCGDGTIYRASGFVLTGITQNSTLYQFPDGEKVSNLGIKTGYAFQRRKFGRVVLGEEALREAKRMGAVKVPGFQLRYLYFLKPEERANLTVPILPFTEIDRVGAGMYKGQKRERSAESGTPGSTGRGRCNTTRSLQLGEGSSDHEQGG